MLGCVVPKRCGCGEPFFVPAFSAADTLLPGWQTRFEQAICPACNARIAQNVAEQRAMGMDCIHLATCNYGQNGDCLSDMGCPEYVVDAGDDPCAICPIQDCNGSHCSTGADADDKVVIFPTHYSSIVQDRDAYGN